MTLVVPGTLKKAAKNWWVYEKGFKEWNAFTHGLVKAFFHLQYANLMRMELEQRSQDFDGPLISYIHTIQLFSE